MIKNLHEIFNISRLIPYISNVFVGRSLNDQWILYIIIM